MKKIVFGVIIMMLGVFMLFRNLEFIPWNISHWVLSWQSLLIAIGTIMLFDRKTDNKNAGVILIMVGTVFLLPKILDVNLSGIIVPAIVIAIGIIFIIRVSTRKKWNGFFSNVHVWKGSEWKDGEWKDHEWKDYDYTKKKFTKTNMSGDGCIKRDYVFDGTKERWTYGKLRDVEIEAVFSGVTLDLSQAELSEDVKNAVYVKVRSVFSGVILYVPDDWNIMIQKTGAFGGFTDNRPRNIEINENKKVILELEAVFGGGEIRCYE